MIKYHYDTACWMYTINGVRYGSFLTEQDAQVNYDIHRNNMRLSKFANDPVHFDSGWWFWDETWGNRYGPYGAKQEAYDNLRLYCQGLDTGNYGDFIHCSMESGLQKQPDNLSSKPSFFRKMRTTTLQATGITTTLTAPVYTRFQRKIVAAMMDEQLVMDPVFDSRGLLISINLVSVKPKQLDNLLKDSIYEADYRTRWEEDEVNLDG